MLALPSHDFPLLPHVELMPAKATRALLREDNLFFKVKWDEIRTLLFQAGDDLLLQSDDTKSMNR